MNNNHIEIGDVKIAIDEKIAISFNSALADREEIVFDNTEKINPRGPVLYPINIKSSAEANKALDYIAHPQKKGSNPKIENVLLYSDGELIDRGMIEVLQAKTNEHVRHQEEYSINFMTQYLGNYMDLIDGKTLKDLQMHEVIEIPDNLLDDTSTYMYTSLELPVKDIFANPGILGDELIIDVALRNIPLPYRYDQEGLWYEYPHEYLASTAIFIEQYLTTPSEYFCFPSVFCPKNISLKDDTWINFYDNGLIADYKYPTYVKRLIDTGINYSGTTTSGSGVSDPNTWKYLEYEALRNAIVPMYYYHQILRHCFSEFGYELSDEFIDDEVFKTITLFNSYDILERELLWLGNIYNQPDISTHVWYHEKRTEINPKNHLPDIEIKEFLRDFMMKFNCSFVFEGKKVKLAFQKLENVGQTIENVHPEKIIDIDPEVGLILKYNMAESDLTYAQILKSNIKLTDLPDSSMFATLKINDYYLSTGSNSIYQKIDNNINHSKYVCLNLVPYYSGDAREFIMPIPAITNVWTEYVLKYNNGVQWMGSPFKCRSLIPSANFDIGNKEPTVHNYIYDREDVLDIVDSTGLWWQMMRHVFINFGTTSTDRSTVEYPRIGFYRGFVPLRLNDTGTITGNEFPFLTHNNFIPGETIPFNYYNLSIIGKYSFTKIFWRDFINIFNNHRKFTFKDYISWQFIKNFKWQESTIIDGSKYYVATINAELPITGQSQIIAYEL